jgi:hypothetical protein
MENNNNQAGGIGFCGLLTIVFIVLKLTEVIAWSWWWVLSPLWLPITAVLAVMVIVPLVMLILVAVGGLLLTGYNKLFKRKS